MRILRDRKEKARRGIDEIQVVEADARKFGKGDRQNREINAGDAETKRQKSNRGAADSRHWNDSKESKPRCNTEASEQHRGNVAAEAGIDRVAERELPGKSHHDIPGLAGESEVEHDDQDGQQVIVDEPGRDHKNSEQNAEQYRCAKRNIAEQRTRHKGQTIAEMGGGLGSHQIDLLPKIPCGRNNSTRTRIAKANMLLAEGVNRSPAKASVTPIKRPPKSAPAIEPSPPVMTMTKASSVYVGPMVGVTSTIKVIMTPAAPTQAAPMPNVSA